MNGIDKISNELMIGFLIDKLDTLGNKKFQGNLRKTLKKELKCKKPTPNVDEFNTFMLAKGFCTNGDFNNSAARIKAENTIHELYKQYIEKTLKLLRARTIRNRSELESHKILAKFLESTPNCPLNPGAIIDQENQQMISFIEKAIASIVERSWIIFWTFNQVGEDRLIVHEGSFQRKYDPKISSSALHAFDELLILNFSQQFLKSLNQLVFDISYRVGEVRDSFEGIDEIAIYDFSLASEAFGVLIGDLVGGIDALRTIIRQVTRIEEIQSLAHKEIELLNGFGQEIKLKISNGKNLNILRHNLEENIKILRNLQDSIRSLEKDAHKGSINVNLKTFHSAIIELPIQLREAKIWANRFMDIAYLTPESGGVAIASSKDEDSYEHEKGVLVEAIGIHKTYRPSNNTVYALRGANIKIRQGEFVAVLGPSGAGKTTLINIMAGLDIPDRGVVYFNGKDISHMSDNELSAFRRNNIGFVFQQYLLDPRLKVHENVSLPAIMAGKTKDLDNRVRELLENLGLSEYANQDPMKLSGGQMQRVIIARACINSPSVVFADEPTGDLDSETGKQVLATFRHLCDEKRISFVVVTHDQEMAAFADRIIQMKDGQLIEI